MKIITSIGSSQPLNNSQPLRREKSDNINFQMAPVRVDKAQKPAIDALRQGLQKLTTFQTAVKQANRNGLKADVVSAVAEEVKTGQKLVIYA